MMQERSLSAPRDELSRTLSLYGKQRSMFKSTGRDKRNRFNKKVQQIKMNTQTNQLQDRNLEGRGFNIVDNFMTSLRDIREPRGTFASTIPRFNVGLGDGPSAFETTDPHPRDQIGAGAIQQDSNNPPLGDNVLPVDPSGDWKSTQNRRIKAREAGLAHAFHPPMLPRGGFDQQSNVVVQHVRRPTFQSSQAPHNDNVDAPTAPIQQAPRADLPTSAHTTEVSEMQDAEMAFDSAPYPQVPDEYKSNQLIAPFGGGPRAKRDDG